MDVLNLHIWNLEVLATPGYPVKSHKEISSCIGGVGGLKIEEGTPEIVTGNRGGTVKAKYLLLIWNLFRKETRDCWTVAFVNVLFVLAMTLGISNCLPSEIYHCGRKQA